MSQPSTSQIPAPAPAPAPPVNPPAPAPAPITIKEICLNTPTPFEGDRKKLNDFIMENEMFFLMNYRIYTTDDRKIIFAMSYMTGENALLWKQSFWKKSNAAGSLDTWDDFKTTLRASFDVVDKEGDAITQLQNALMTGKTANEFIEEFKLYAGHSRVTQDRPLIEWFMAALPDSLRDKILQMETPPTTITGWYTTASKFDNNWRRWKSVTNRLKGDTDTKKKGFKFPPKYSPSIYKDPNTMDTRKDFIKA